MRVKKLLYGIANMDVVGGSKGRAYSVWHNMLKRCYYKNDHNYRKYGAKGCVVSNEWLVFSRFKAWYDTNYVNGWFIDKDLLGDGLLYSKGTCCFLPKCINNALININNRNTSGATWCKSNEKWKVSISKYNKNIHLGYFENIHEARLCYQFHRKIYLKELSDKYFESLCFDAYNMLVCYA